MIRKDHTHHARVAALGMAHVSALAKLLRAHGRNGHADHLEAAVDEVVEIIAKEVGRSTLAQAMSWVTDELWDCHTPGAAKAQHH